jgi:hypothetical protein
MLKINLLFFFHFMLQLPILSFYWLSSILSPECITAVQVCTHTHTLSLTHTHTHIHTHFCHPHALLCLVMLSQHTHNTFTTHTLHTLVTRMLYCCSGMHSLSLSLKHTHTHNTHTHTHTHTHSVVVSSKEYKDLHTYTLSLYLSQWQDVTNKKAINASKVAHIPHTRE